MKKILVLEDESNIRSFVVINLRRNGFEPIEAENGEQALEKLKVNPGICLALLLLITALYVLPMQRLHRYLPIENIKSRK